ncbi:MAG TPA: hypothetical protein VEX88_09465 [Glaciibacter sp.]|nr:hypothetical protein [Glaciibacter sp.]
MSDASNARKSSEPIDETAVDESTASESSEQTAGAGANNPARPSETGGNSIEIGDTIQDMVEIDPSQP